MIRAGHGGDDQKGQCNKWRRLCKPGSLAVKQTTLMAIPLQPLFGSAILPDRGDRTTQTPTSRLSASAPGRATWFNVALWYWRLVSSGPPPTCASPSAHNTTPLEGHVNHSSDAMCPRKPTTQTSTAYRGFSSFPATNGPAMTCKFYRIR